MKKENYRTQEILRFSLIFINSQIMEILIIEEPELKAKLAERLLQRAKKFKNASCLLWFL
ncbi:hypothetical protein MWN41_00180 [Ornithobacterium rhinotracheale]|uniref:hypothetical protein n=1 Tax=Ornithobacterium rhinotracheale TaxID=28251 RepID=UPI001FF3CFD9|nr:hypothetical protein [Ornithobacterium rhinotracheale]MCK0201440.1 hypothetical protein [Ornithobacterium rhinotracheale]